MTRSSVVPVPPFYDLEANRTHCGSPARPRPPPPPPSMPSTRTPPMAAPLLAAAALGLSACGGSGLPGNAVATVGDQTIKRDPFRHRHPTNALPPAAQRPPPARPTTAP